MESTEQVFDSPQGWIHDHIQQYVESNGEQGHHWRGMTTLLLTTRGRKSAPSATVQTSMMTNPSQRMSG